MSEALARLHAACFEDGPRPWTAAEFAQFARDDDTVIVEKPGGVAVLRCVLDEAELLTIAVAPEKRREGLGRVLLDGVIAAARERGAVKIFLEVAADNAAARRLYARAGFVLSGHRKGYYRRAGGHRVDALVLQRDLSEGML